MLKMLSLTMPSFIRKIFGFWLKDVSIKHEYFRCTFNFVTQLEAQDNVSDLGLN